MLLKIKPDEWHQGYAALLDILDLPNMTWQADPRAGVINIDTEGHVITEATWQQIVLWKMRYS